MIRGTHQKYPSDRKRAAWLEHLVREEMEDRLDFHLEGPDLLSDLLFDAFDRINWIEIVENNA